MDSGSDVVGVALRVRHGTLGRTETRLTTVDHPTGRVVPFDEGSFGLRNLCVTAKTTSHGFGPLWAKEDFLVCQKPRRRTLQVGTEVGQEKPRLTPRTSTPGRLCRPHCLQRPSTVRFPVSKRSRDTQRTRQEIPLEPRVFSR